MRNASVAMWLHGCVWLVSSWLRVWCVVCGACMHVCMCACVRVCCLPPYGCLRACLRRCVFAWWCGLPGCMGAGSGWVLALMLVCLCTFVALYLRAPARLCACRPACPLVCLSACLLVCLSACLLVCLSACCLPGCLVVLVLASKKRWDFGDCGD